MASSRASSAGEARASHYGPSASCGDAVKPGLDLGAGDLGRGFDPECFDPRGLGTGDLGVDAGDAND